MLAEQSSDSAAPFARRGRNQPSLLVPAITIGALVLAAVALVIFAIGRPEPPSFMPTAVGALPPPDPSGAHVITIDASSPAAWRFLSFEHGLLPGHATGPHWDLAFRRFHIIANGGPGFAGRGGILDLGDVPFDSVRFAPSDGYALTTIVSGDSVNPAIQRWYRYGFTSHLLTPLGHTYVVRGAGGRTVKLEILGYYCPGAKPGCVTVRWAELQPVGRRLRGAGRDPRVESGLPVLDG